MLVVYYALTFMFGLLVAGGIIRAIEHLALGGRINPAQHSITIVASFLGWFFYTKARKR